PETKTPDDSSHRGFLHTRGQKSFSDYFPPVRSGPTRRKNVSSTNQALAPAAPSPYSGPKNRREVLGGVGHDVHHGCTRRVDHPGTRRRAERCPARAPQPAAAFGHRVLDHVD